MSLNDPGSVTVAIVLVGAFVRWLLKPSITSGTDEAPAPAPTPVVDWREARRQSCDRERQIRAAEATKREENSERIATEILGRRRELVDRFLEIAGRQVGRRDEYGMERWRDLPKLIFECIVRIGEVEGFTVSSERKNGYRSGSTYGPQAWGPHDRWRIYGVLFGKLENVFKRSHALRTNRPDDCAQSKSGEEFELCLASKLAALGCKFKMTPKTGDQGADLIVRFGDRKIAVQAKHWAGSVSNSAVQEVIAAKGYYACNEAWVVTTSAFTKSAMEIASAHSVVLVEGVELPFLEQVLHKAHQEPRQKNLFV